jgi:hypothetical protein
MHNSPARSSWALTVALRLGPHRGRTISLATLRATQPSHDVSEQCIPSGGAREGLRLRRTSVAALARENQNVLSEMIGQLDDGKRRTRGHHLPIVAGPA